LAKILSEAAMAALPAKPPTLFKSRYVAYAVILMGAIHMINYMDRFLMTMLLEPTKAEFGLSDLWAGLLSGFGFVALYAILSLPMARLAQRFSRRRLLALSLALFSTMTGLCGIASSFVMLFLFRLGVGVGETAVLPSIHSLVSDMTSPRRRGLAMSVIGVGATLGAMLGFGFGGWMASQHGWRPAFLAGMAPGLILAVIAWLTLRDPPRGLSDGVENHVPPPPLGTALRLLWQRRSYRYLSLGTALLLHPCAWYDAPADLDNRAEHEQGAGGRAAESAQRAEARRCCRSRGDRVVREQSDFG